MQRRIRPAVDLTAEPRTVAEDALYFTADSQGQKFLDQKTPMPPGEMRDAVILKLPLR